jgi:hypothetical protein
MFLNSMKKPPPLSSILKTKYHMPIAFGFTNNRKFSIINMLSIYQLSYSTLKLVSSNVNDVTIIKKIVENTSYK